MMMKCTKCKNDLFRITERIECDECSENVDQSVEDDMCCKFGDAYGAGCNIFECSVCNKIEHRPFSDWC